MNNPVLILLSLLSLTFSLERNTIFNIDINNQKNISQISSSPINETFSFSETKDNPLGNLIHFAVGFILFCLVAACCCGYISGRIRARQVHYYSAPQEETTTQVVVPYQEEPDVPDVTYQKKEAVIIQNDMVAYLRYDELRYDN